MKHLFVILILLALLSQSFRNAVIVGDYYVNTDAYAKNCENKARPQLHCNGHCQMMKKLNREEQKDKQSPERYEQVLSSKSFFATILRCGTSSPVIYPEQYTDLSAGIQHDFFHPPGIA